MSKSAQKRTDLHNGHASQRILSDGHDDVGMAGEWAFARLCGQMPDLRNRPGGDGGIDFTVYLGFTVDVKTYRKPGHLLLEVGKPAADILVLAGYSETTGDAKLLGWEWGQAVSRAPTREFGYGIVNHYVPADCLRPMKELAWRLERREFGEIEHE